ncbi:MAG: lysyl-tRNA synthetase, class, partial [Actinomycetota bacterium]|nr:lysyl-tRNA synthetase, class [Actinomycetota bacterium]
SQRVEELRAVCDTLGVPSEKSWGSGKLVLEIYEKTTESKIEAPTFVCDYPREVSPLARVHRDDPTLTERFELIVHGRELANAFSELNDPVDQLRRFEAQASLKRLGDDEAHDIDFDYVRALEYGLPPTGGLGLGVDRLVMVLAGVTSIREVILFPHMRPEAEKS